MGIDRTSPRDRNPPRARAGRRIVIPNTILLNILKFASQGASAYIPKDQWRMSLGELYCRRWGDTYRVEEAVGLAHGTLVEVNVPKEASERLEEIGMRNQRRGVFNGGWFHTRPGGGLYMSNTDIKIQLSHQYRNPDAFALVFDHTTMRPASLGFGLYRLDNTDDPESPFNLEVPFAELTSYEVLDFMLEGVTLESLTEAVNLFQKPGFPIGTLWESIKYRASNNPPPRLPDRLPTARTLQDIQRAEKGLEPIFDEGRDQERD